MVTYIGLDAINVIHTDAKGTEDTLYGLGGDDELTATAQLLVFMYGGSGTDMLFHRPFDEFGPLDHANIYGGEGNDRIFGGSGSEQLFGDDGIETIGGQSGSDKINGGPGDDFFLGEGFFASPTTEVGAAGILLAARSSSGFIEHRCR